MVKYTYEQRKVTRTQDEYAKTAFGCSKQNKVTKLVWCVLQDNAILCEARSRAKAIKITEALRYATLYNLID